MMQNNTFRTVFYPKKSDSEISHKTKIVLSGSCFTENIGQKLKTLKFDVLINPFGIIYNPFSLAESLNFILDKKQFQKKDLIFHNEYWHSFAHHGKFSEPEYEKVLSKINDMSVIAYEKLLKADFLFLTLGTARVYIHKKTNNIVANCHKIPASEFDKKLLSVNEITEHFLKTLKALKKINNKVKIIFSVSPVRHLKDGFPENFLSKSVLRVSIENILSEIEDTYYFPAYEILTDDLRNYGFYASDMVHPNETATDYIFDFFSEHFFSDETKKIINTVKKINSARCHKIFNPKTEQTKKFLNSSLNLITNLNEKYPYLNLEEEKKYFENLLK